MDESVRRKPISSSSSALMDESGRRKPMSSSLMDESGRRKPMSSPLMDESGRRKPISSSSSSMDGSTRREPITGLGLNDAEQKTGGRIKKAHENLKAPRPNSMATPAAKLDDFKHHISGRNHQNLKMPIIHDLDVDKSADDFINSFRQNLKIERTESMDEYKGMLDRGV
ncbi:uncharacterized protein LOC131034178 [Cryptomeria japonica]|uniref:uncharacterized protein LOC131034178 n=1 Tax=Cryptomeria japonica TaxID=3369 RepID=UPI0027DAB445|nr:uncharacterized protein LOC131034178 [Cryptomeria japonica]